MTNNDSKVDRREFFAVSGVALMGAAIDGEFSHSALPAVRAAEWDMSWVARLTGKYRTVFDSPDINDGTVFVNAFTFIAGYREVYAATDADIQPVLVLRGNGVHMAFADSIWQKYELNAELKVAGNGNPHLGSIAALRQRGATLLACNIAATYYAAEIAKRRGAQASDVLADIKSTLPPGIILQPSGVFATIRAQQAGCWFMKSA